MVKVKIENENDELDAESTIQRKVKKFGPKSAHIIMPKKTIGQNATIIIHEPVGSWTSGMARAMRKKGIFPEKTKWKE